MAARRITKTNINWSSLAERVPPNQKTSFTAFKSKSDKYLRSVTANPEKAPAIDWSFYKNRVALAGLVDNFQKQYEALKIPYPADNVSAKIDAQANTVKSSIETYVKESNARINGFENDISHLKSLLPYDQMTMEDYRDSFPDSALDPINRPTFWPHNPEEQDDHKKSDSPAH